MAERETPLHITKNKTYISVWVSLLTLTAITVAVTRLHLTRYAIFVAILIATVKSGLVITYFMHLKYEPWILKVMLFIALLALTLIIALTFTDILYR